MFVSWVTCFTWTFILKRSNPVSEKPKKKSLYDANKTVKAVFTFQTPIFVEQI